jgi:magnesium chelatase family protein
MQLAIVKTRAQVGVEAVPVTIEVHLTAGLPSLSIVGLPETAVKESKERVRSALLSNDFVFPMQRITVNLAPADLPKEGGRFDLAIALGILAASKQIKAKLLEHYEVVGELALTGELRPVRGILPFALAARQQQRGVIIPQQNLAEAMMITNVEIFAFDNLHQICAYLNQEEIIEPILVTHNPLTSSNDDPYRDLSEVRGQHHAKRALEVAAAGGHNLLMVGPPGTGKTMLASRLNGILPPMSEAEALGSAIIASVAHSSGFEVKNWGVRPFRTPHHTASSAALVGGGTQPRPGEVSLAHNGVLFLDELPEFQRWALEVLREPLEEGKITISRVAGQAEFPAKIQLIAAMNPCPCGYFGDTNNRCICSQEKIRRYRAKISGPLLDRIDIHIEVPNLPRTELQHKTQAESSTTVRERVVQARQIQWQRNGNIANAHLTNREIEQFCQLKDTDQQLLAAAIGQLGLSARAWFRILKVARTIADLANSDEIKTSHLTEAISYRRLERDLR